MFLKIICLCLVAANISAAPSTDDVPSERPQPSVIPIISLSAEYETDGKFKYSYETGNGIKRQETAYDKEPQEGKSSSDSSNEGGEDDDDSGEIHVQEGSYSYTAPDGTLVSVSYIADENGFQPINEHITFGSRSFSKQTDDKAQIIKVGIQEKENKQKLQFGDKLVISQKIIDKSPKKNEKISEKSNSATNKDFNNNTHQEPTMKTKKENESDDNHINKNGRNTSEQGKESNNKLNNKNATQNTAILSKKLANVSENAVVKESKATNATIYEAKNISEGNNISRKSPIKLGEIPEKRMSGEGKESQRTDQNLPENSTKDNSELKQLTEENETISLIENKPFKNLTKNQGKAKNETKIKILEIDEKHSQEPTIQNETDVMPQKENIKLENKPIILKNKSSERTPTQNANYKPIKGNEVSSPKPPRANENLLEDKLKLAKNVTNGGNNLAKLKNIPDIITDIRTKDKEGSSQKLNSETSNQENTTEKLREEGNKFVKDEKKNSSKSVKNEAKISNNKTIDSKEFNETSMFDKEEKAAKQTPSNNNESLDLEKSAKNITNLETIASKKDERSNASRKRPVKDNKKPNKDHVINKTSLLDAQKSSEDKKEINDNTNLNVTNPVRDSKKVAEKPNRNLSENLGKTQIKPGVTNKNSSTNTSEILTKNSSKEVQKTGGKNALPVIVTARPIVEYSQKSTIEAAKHEKFAENAAKTAVQAAEVAENAANTAEKAAKETERFANIAKNPGNESKELAIKAAEEQAKLAEKAAEEASHAAEIAEIAADDANKAAKAADKVVQSVHSVAKPEDNKFAKNANNSASDTEKSATETVNVVKQQNKMSKSHLETNKIVEQNVNMTISNEHKAQSKSEKKVKTPNASDTIEMPQKS